jgi:N-methylhydantoinase B/oxoprolinase/acetone carboxylase alpha subunit
VDPITTEVIRYELVAAAEEMQKVFRRSTMSMTLYELNDFGCRFLTPSSTCWPTHQACVCSPGA